MAGVGTMYAPSAYQVQDSLRLWNLAGMWNYLSGEKGSGADSRSGPKAHPIEDLTAPKVPNHASISPPTAAHTNANNSEPAIGEDGELLNGASVSCTVCHKKFANVHRLQRHMISHNESDVLRRFKCDECGKAFKFKHHLKEHKRIHSGEKPFECEHCGKRFSHSGSYSSHMSSKKCQLGRTRASVSFVNRSSPQYCSKRAPPPNAPFLPILPKGDSPTPSDLGYSSPTRPISQDTLLMSTPSLVSPGGIPNSPLTPGIHPGFTPALQHSALPTSLPQGLSPYHPFNSLILAAQLQPQYTLLSLLSKNEREVCASRELERRDLRNESREDDGDRDPGKLVIKEDAKDAEDAEDERRLEEHTTTTSGYPSLQHVLDKVNCSVTKMKFDEVVSLASTNSLLHTTATADDLRCHLCGAIFCNHLEAAQHSRLHCPRLADVSSAQESYKGQLIEGLAARLYKEAGGIHRDLRDLSCQNVPQYGSHNGYYLREDPDYDFNHVIDDEETMSDGKKVRVRSHIREDQLAILRAHYNMNPRPKKDELQNIADKVNFPIRVVQVWFQNSRARDRREGRCLTPNSLSFLPHHQFPHLPYPPSSTTASSLVASSLISSNSFPPKQLVSSYYPLLGSDRHLNSQMESFISQESAVDPVHREDDEDPKPLDLSTRKTSSPLPSPKASSSVSDSDNDSTTLAISYKSESRTPTPNSTTFNNNNLSESKDQMASNLSSLVSEHRSKLASILSASKGLSGLQPSTFGENEINNKRRRDDDGSGDEMRKRRRDEEIGIFQCDQCDKSFNKQSSLARHKYEHSGMRPYKCDLCTKAFKHKHHLTEHSRLHTGEKPYQCYKCLKRFSHSGSYSQHMNHRFSYCKPYSSGGNASPFAGRPSNSLTPASSPGGADAPQDQRSSSNSPTLDSRPNSSNKDESSPSSNLEFEDHPKSENTDGEATDAAAA